MTDRPDYLDAGFDLDDPAVASAIDEVSLWSSRFGAMLFEHLELRPGITALDLGCGTGFPLIELAQMHGASSRFVGIDVWSHGLRRARARLDFHGLPTVALVRGDGAMLPFVDGAFDLVVSNVGVNNFADLEETLRECARVTAPGGRIALTTNPEGHLRELYDAFAAELRERGLDGMVGALAAEASHRVGAAPLAEMLEATGFRVSRRMDGGFRMRYLDGGTFLRHSLTRIGFLDSWRRVVGPSLEREVFAGLEARLDRLADASGELVMSVPMLYLEGVRR